MSLEDFFENEEEVTWGSVVEKEIRRRIKLSIAAYSYEFCDHSIIDDATFDKMCSEVDLSIDTGSKKLDKWFKKEFDPSTGQWIHKHPELDKIRILYEKYYKRKKTLK